MKKIFLSLGLVLLLLMSSCIDIYQHISQGTGGQTDVYLRLTVAKAVFDMEARMSGGSDTTDWDQMLSETDAPAKELLSEFGRAEMGKINTDLEFGIYYHATLNYGNKALADRWNSPESVFVPFVQNGKVTIKTSFPTGADQTGNAMATVFLSTAKYVITVDKRVCPSLKTATVQSGDVKTVLDVTDMGDQFYASVPIAILFNGDSVIVLE